MNERGFCCNIDTGNHRHLLMKRHLHFIHIALLPFLLSAVHAAAQKQKATITGMVLSDSARKGLAEAHVSLVNAVDSTVIAIQTTDEKGKFSFNKVDTGTYNLLFHAFGYKPALRYLHIDHAEQYRFDSVALQASYNTLDPVTVVGSRIPVILKKDTTEFDATSFKVRPNAMLEELIKKNPGLQVDEDGTLTVQGEKVTQVLVDGKPFFSGDTKTTIQNLPADIVSKIQVIDQKSDQARHTKVEDGKKNKVVNIIIKPDKKVGYFGTAYGGYGTQKRYEAKLNANHFNGDRKMALIGSANNTGRNDFSTGGNGQESSSYNTNGLQDNKQLRFTYGDAIGKKFNYNANFGFTRNGYTNASTSRQQNIYGDSSNYTFSQTNNNGTQKNYNGNVSFEWKPDSTTEIRMSEAFALSRGLHESARDFNTALSTNRKINEGNSRYNSNSRTPSFNGQLSYNKELSKKGRNIFASISHNNSNSRNNDLNKSENYFYPVNSNPYQQLFNQHINSRNNNSGFSTAIGYNEPLDSFSAINITYNYNHAVNNNNKNTFDYNPATGLYDLRNDSLSNHFDNRNDNHSIGLNYIRSFKKGGFTLGAQWQHASQQSMSITNDSVYRQRFSNITPNVSVYMNNKSWRMNLNYNYNIVQPQAYQLQPVINNSNPLFLSLGNPSLTYAINHNIRYYFYYYNRKNDLSFNASGGVVLMHNQITSSTELNPETGQQITRPINMNGGYNGNGYFFFGIPLTPRQGKNRIYLNQSMSFNLSRSVGLLNKAPNTTTSLYLYYAAGANIMLKEWFDMHLNLNITRVSSRYTQQANMSNVNYYYGASSSFIIRIPHLTELNLNYSLRKNTGQTQGFNQDVHLLGAEITQYFSSRRNIWIKLKGFDLLKQNKSIYRYVNASSITDVQSMVLSRYFLFSLNFRLNKFTAR